MVSQVSDDADLALTAIAGLATAVVLTIAAIVLFFIAAAKFTNRVGKLAGQYYYARRDKITQSTESVARTFTPPQWVDQAQASARLAASPHKPASQSVGAAAVDLNQMSIRQLKRLASDRKIPKYSNLTKSQLVEVLSAWGCGGGAPITGVPP
jgi:hypothetical protein